MEARGAPATRAANGAAAAVRVAPPISLIIKASTTHGPLSSCALLKMCKCVLVGGSTTLSKTRACTMATAGSRPPLRGAGGVMYLMYAAIGVRGSEEGLRRASERAAMSALPSSKPVSGLRVGSTVHRGGCPDGGRRGRPASDRRLPWQPAAALRSGMPPASVGQLATKSYSRRLTARVCPAPARTSRRIWSLHTASVSSRACCINWGATVARASP
jgi:hypothetical protein